MPPFPLDKTRKFFPGLGDQHVVTLLDVGFSAVDATLTLNTTQSDAQIIASPPSTATPSVPTSVIVHSLGAPPGMVVIMPVSPQTISGIQSAVVAALITADNSAVYVRAQTWTNAQSPGVRARVYAVRAS